MASMVASGNRDGQSLVLQGVDPETCMIVFKNHWAQVSFLVLQLHPFVYLHIISHIFACSLRLISIDEKAC